MKFKTLDEVAAMSPEELLLYKTETIKESIQNNINLMDITDKLMDSNVLLKANDIINGPRRDSYGPVEKSFVDLAKVWSIILKTEVTPRQFGLCMIALKVLREANKHEIDNLVDIAGYTALTEKVKDL
jgi:hypothetical protein